MYHFETNFKLYQGFKMENVIASPIRELSERASKCLLEYETLYNTSRLSISDEDYNHFSRLLMDDSASDADDEVTDTSHEELNSSTEVYKPRNVYSITDGNKPFTLVFKKQQNSNNIDDISYKSREAQFIVNSGISDEFPLYNFEHVNNTLETVALDHISTKEKRQDNETQYKPTECVEGTTTERKTFPLQDFNRFCDVTSKILQKHSDPTISGYEANCESEDEVGNSHRMLKCNGSNVGLEDRVMNQHYGTGFCGKHSVVQRDNIGKMQSSISNMESTALNKNKELNCTVHCSSINDHILDQSCTHKANKLANEDTYSANEYNDVKINKDLHESDSGMESFPKNNCILDYTNNQVLSTHSLQNDDACHAVNHLHGNDLTCNKMENDAGVHLDDRESNSAFSDVRNAAEDGEHSIKDNEVTENYRIGKESGGGITNTLEIIDNECEMLLHVIHKIQMETAAENEITSEAVHESLSEETNKQGAFSLDVTENRSKPNANDLTCNKVKNDAYVHLDNRESNAAVSDVRNAAEDGEYSIKDNEGTENYRIGKERDGGISNTLEIIENECEMASHVVHKAQIETAAENEITSEAFHESLFEGTNKQGAFSLDVTENRSKPNANDLTCNKVKSDACVHLDNRENNSAVSDVRNAAEDGEHSIKDNEVTENYRIGNESDGGISNTLEIIENECEMASHAVHKAQMETAAENDITSEAFHESVFEETNKQGAFSLDVTEDRSKPNANDLTCNKVKSDACVHLDNRENNSAVSDVRNAAEDGEHSIKDNEVTENYRIGNESDGGISNTLEIIENECEMASHAVHKAQMETAAENDITSEAFHESLFEETNKQGAFSLDVTENRSKPIQTYPRCERVEDLQMYDFDHSEEHKEQKTVVERSEAEESALNINFLNNFGTDHAVLSQQKFENEKIKQTEVVNSVSITLEEKENKILESSIDKYQSEAGTSCFVSEIPLSNVSSAAVQKEDGVKILEPLGKSNAVSKLETKAKDDRAFPGDSFADDTMDCSYNDSSSCLDRSPLLFSSDEENYYYTEDSVAEETSKSYESENQALQERRKLRRLQRALAGVPPPPSVTIPQLDVNEMLKLIKENQKLMKFDGSAEEKEGSPNGKELTRPLTLFCTEEVKNLPWPEAKTCNFYGVQYNNGKLSEELEALYERLRDRYVGSETLSSCNVWFPGISTKAIEKRMRRRNIGQSPGRRLSHLAKRRQAFSSANLLPSVAGSLPTAAARRGCNRLIMVEVKKGDHRTKAKGQPAKKVALNVNNKLQQTKRALFKSPPSGRKKVSSASKNKSSSKKIKREVDRSKVCNSKRALWPSSGMSENTMPGSNTSRQLKRQREESEDEGRHNKFPRRSLFGERDREKEGSNPKVLHANSSNGQVLSQQHKKKLLWAVAETLRTKGVSMNHPSFKTLASSLARKVCSSLPDMSKKREGRTSEFMLQISKEHVDNILKTSALQDKTDLIKV